MSVISIKDFCENYNHKDNNFNIDATDFYSEDREDILLNSKAVNINGVDATILDLLNIPYEDDLQIIRLIKKELKIDINTSEGIEEINNILFQSIEYYQKRYLKRLPNRILKQKFKTTNSIIKFLKDTKINKKTGILNCVIAKVGLATKTVLDSEKVQRRNQLELNFTNDYINTPFQIIDTKRDDNGNIYKKGSAIIFLENNERKIIDFEVIIRIKGPDSIIGKNIGDPKYSSIEDFKDLIQVTYYIKNQYDLIDLMKYNGDIVYGDDFEVSDKDGLCKEIFNSKNIADGNFKIRVINALSKQYGEKKLFSCDDYREIKQKGVSKNRLEKSINSSNYEIGTEIKYVIKGHDNEKGLSFQPIYDNEKGLSFQPIYDYQKRFRELTRLGLPIRKMDIINYVNDFFEKIDENLKIKKKEKFAYYDELFIDLIKNGFIDGNKLNLKTQKDFDQLITTSEGEKELAKGLFLYFKSKLVKVKSRIGNKKYFYLSNEAIELQKVGLYPKEIEKAVS